MVHRLKTKAKRQRYSTYIAPQAAYCSWNGADHHRAGVQSRSQAKPTLTDFCLQTHSRT